MNPRIYVAVAAASLVAVLGVVAFSDQSIISDVPGGPQPDGPVVLPLQVRLLGIDVSEINERGATIDVSFEVTNPNQKSVILPFLKYELYESGERIHIGEIGERLDSFVIGSNYFTILPDQPTRLSDTIIIQNTGGAPDLWARLSGGTASWSVSGEALFNLSSMTAGGENIVTFEFTP